jgi:hypothetical protein
VPESRLLQGEPAVAIADSLVITPVSDRVADLAQLDGSEWSAADLLFFIREETSRLCGPQVPCNREEKIASEFLSRFGADGVMIARAAYEVHSGRWMGAPITIRRFSESNDEFFARAILGQLCG